MDGVQIVPIVMAIIAGCSLTYAVLTKRSGSAQEIASDLAAYKVEQADLHARSDENIKTMMKDIGEIKETLHRMEAR